MGGINRVEYARNETVIHLNSCSDLKATDDEEELSDLEHSGMD